MHDRSVASRAVLAGLLAGAVLVGSAACSSTPDGAGAAGGPSVSDAGATSGGNQSSPSDTSADAGSAPTKGTTTPKKSPGGPGSLSAGDVDLSGAPGLLATRGKGSGHELLYYERPDAGPTVVTFDDDNQKFEVAPDGRTVAVAHNGDAVNKAKLEMLATDTGEVSKSWDIDADRVKIVAWSPDSTTVLVDATRKTTSSALYRIDGSTQTLTESSSKDLWAASSAGTTLVEDCKTYNCENERGYATVLVTSKGVPVVLITKGSTSSTREVGTYDADTKQLHHLASPYDGAGKVENVNDCGRFGRIREREGTKQAYAIFDSDTGKVTPMPDGLEGCPVLSNDGKSVAVAARDGNVTPRIVDLASGAAVTAGREGKPIAWSKDDSTLVVWVAGKGTYAVHADGSGGDATSVPLESSCTLGASGVVLAETTKRESATQDLALYDIGSGKATEIGKGNISDRCTLSGDGKWVLSGSTIVDVEHGTVGELKDAGAKDSAPAINILTWRQPSAVVIALPS